VELEPKKICLAMRCAPPRFELHGMQAATRLSMSCFLSGAADGGTM